MPPVLTLEADAAETSQTPPAPVRDPRFGEWEVVDVDPVARANEASFALLEQLEAEIRALLLDPSGPDAMNVRRRIVAAGLEWPRVADCVPSRAGALAWWGRGLS